MATHQQRASTSGGRAKRGAQGFVLSLSLLSASIGSVFAQAVSNEEQYNSALINGGSTAGRISITAPGFDITAKPNAPGGSVFLAGSSGAISTLKGGGELAVWSAFSDVDTEFSLTRMLNLRFENFGDSAIRNEQAMGFLSNTTFVNNSTRSVGGALSARGGFSSTHYIKDSLFIGNKAIAVSGDLETGHGGALFVQNSLPEIENSRFIRNESTRAGGAIYFDMDSTNTFAKEINDSVFIDNRSGGMGAAIFNNGNSLRVSDSIFLNNFAYGGTQVSNGGAIYSLNQNGDGTPLNLNFAHSLFYGNKHAGNFPYNFLSLSGSAGSVTNVMLGGYLFDPIFSSDTGLKTRFEVDAYLGGSTTIAGPSEWSAALFMTSVAYNNGPNDAVYTPAAIVLSHPDSTFYGDLKGSGTLDVENIRLRIIAPSTVVSSGMRAFDITPDITQTQILGIVPVQKSAVGSLTLVGNLAVGSSGDPDSFIVSYAYHVSVENSDSYDTVKILGNVPLSRDEDSILGDWSNLSLRLDFLDDSGAGLSDATVLTASEFVPIKPGATGEAAYRAVVPDEIPVRAPVHLTLSTDKAQVVDNQKIVVTTTPGLSWNTTRKTDGKYDATGEFMVGRPDIVNSGTGTPLAEESFTVNGVLADRSDVTPTNSNSEWDGKSLTKNGAGTLFLNGANTYSGLTTVKSSGGVLRVGATAQHATASIAGPILVEPGATIGGHGRLLGALTLDGGIISPGGYFGQTRISNIGNRPILAVNAENAIGTLTVAGDLTMGAGTEYQLEINPDGASDRLAVGGVFKLEGGRLSVHYGGGSGDWDVGSMTYPGIVTASSVEGEFDKIDSHLLFLSPEVVYNPKSIDLIVTRTLGGSGSGSGSGNGSDDGDGDTGGGNNGGGGGSGVGGGSGGGSGSGSGSGVADLYQTGNQLEVARAIAFGLPDTNHPVFQAITNDMTPDQVRTALDNLSGEIHGSTRTALLGNMQVRNMMQARMLGLSAQRRAAAQPVLVAANGTAPVSTAMLRPPMQNLWVNTWGYDGRISGKSNAARIDQSGFGLTLGGDMRVQENLNAGLVFGYEDGKVKSNGRQSRTNIDTYTLGAYALTDLNGFELQGGVNYSWMKLKSERNIVVPTLQGQAKADYRGKRTQVFAEASKAFAVSAVNVAPYLGLTWTRLSTRAARETGSAAALDIAAQSDNVLHSAAGVRVTYQLLDSPMALTADLGWLHAFNKTRMQANNRFAGTNARFTVEGAPVVKNTARIGAGMQAQVGANTTLNVGYQGQFGGKVHNHAGNVQLRMAF